LYGGQRAPCGNDFDLDCRFQGSKVERLQTEVKIRSSVAVRVFNRTDFAGFVAVGREEVKNDFG
jgi:hypothetical protein